MPATADAVSVTDRYREILADLRRTTSVQITRLLLAVDPARLQADIDAWEASAAALGQAGAEASRRLTRAWLIAYARASGVPDPPPEVEVEPLRPVWHTATVAVWWRLAAGEPRTRALRTGGAEATRLAADLVIDTANRHTVATVDADPRTIGYRRVSSGTTCGACLALHGQMVGTADPYDRHGHCRCTAEPVFADVPELAPRPTGQERYAQMTARQRAALFTGRGGARKAELVDANGLETLVDRTGPGQIREAPLTSMEET